ncbi:protein DEHYDRATION-INDUCED 19 homolog 4-like [Amaranthus tricolor]|uniref:protein DEHYDRATION-INDUCED 19 homolog 4-like n=1 Tax=Amaranthus tricolor TaxID=29722 RepID=UPI00258A1772|nr:protein DEHYDRATION-INDUCED 19 homolog 4-like [Amaranthus tricolor]
MNSDFWTSRLAAAKRQFNLQHQHHHQLHSSSHLDRLNVDDFEVEEEVRPDFPCPYCYEEFDVGSLCTHLEDDHPCESRATVCPICSVKVSRDMLSHITLQHAHLFKLQRRRRLRRVAIPNSQALSLLGRDLHEAHLQVLLGGSGFRSSAAHNSNAASDPFLSSLVLNFPGSEVDEFSKSMASSVEDTTSKNASTARYWKPSFDSSLSNEEREKRIHQAVGRAHFVQDLLLCNLLDD